MGPRRPFTIWHASLWLAVAFLAMFAVVLAVIASSDHLPWIAAAGACLALSAYCCARLFMRLFYGR
jgi:hypothetical protein